MKFFTVGQKPLDEFYPTYVTWCKKKGFPVLLKENIEDDIFICHWFRIPVYSCFVWNTNSKMCIIGFPLANPYIPFEFRRKGLPFLFEKMSEVLKKRGYTKIWTTSGTSSVMKSLQQQGFVNADPNVNVYIKML